MRYNILSLLVAVGLIGSASVYADTFGSGANQFTIDFTTIGNPGNAADPLTGYGSVGYNYRIATYETSINQILSATSNGLVGVSAGSQYWNTNWNTPAFGISWLQAAAFVNWLNTSTGHHAAYNLTYTGGVYSMALWQSGQSGYDPSNPFRNSLSTYFLPSENDWYKAAYYDPNKNSGSGGFWLYPTGSDTPPTPIDNQNAGSVSGTAIYNGQYSYDLNRAAAVNKAGGLSPYGTMGQGGNVWDMTESTYDGANTDPSALRVARGGTWETSDIYLQSTHRQPNDFNNPDGYGVQGFRVASVNSNSAQFITNNLTLSLSRAYEAQSFKVGSASITPSPIWKSFSTIDLISQLKKSCPSIITPRATLQVLVDTNDNIHTQVKNENSTNLVNISDVLKIKIGTNGVSSGSLNTTSAISTINNLSTIEIAYDDTAINSSNGMNFTIHAICSSSVLTTPTKTNGVFLVKSTLSTTGGVGDGYYLSTNGKNYFIIRNTAVNAVGGGYLDFQK